MARRTPIPGDGGHYIYYPYFPYGYYGYGGYPYGYWGSGFGLGLGLGYYDPFWYGYDPYGYSGYGYSSGYSGYGSGYGGGGSYSQAPRGTGGLRLKIKPRSAQVFVDGYYAGDVDSFDGAFQRLDVDGGGHKIEIKAEGYEPVQFDVLITPGQTVTYKGEMKHIQ